MEHRHNRCFAHPFHKNKDKDRDKHTHLRAGVQQGLALVAHLLELSGHLVTLQADLAQALQLHVV